MLLSSFFATIERDMDLYEVPLSMSLLSFGMGTMLASFNMCGIKLLLRTVLNMLVRNASVLRCLMYSFSGFCGLQILLCFIGYWT